MKNLRKITRESLKAVKGGGNISDPTVLPDGTLACKRNAQLCEIGCEPKCVIGPCNISECMN